MASKIRRAILWLFLALGLFYGIFGFVVRSVYITVGGGLILAVLTIWVIVRPSKKYEDFGVLDFGFMLAAIPFVLVGGIFCFIGHPIEMASFNGDRWIAIFGAVLTYIGTCFLGVVSLEQNRRAVEQAKTANATNLRMLEVDLIRNNMTVIKPTDIFLYETEGASEDKARLKMVCPPREDTFLCWERCFQMQLNFETNSSLAVKALRIDQMEASLYIGEAILDIDMATHRYKSTGTVDLTDEDWGFRNTILSGDLEKLQNRLFVSVPSSFQYYSHEEGMVESERPSPLSYELLHIQLKLTLVNALGVEVQMNAKFLAETDKRNEANNVRYKVIIGEGSTYNMTIESVRVVQSS